MQYRNLGRSGLKVSEICLGTMTFGHSTDEAEAAAIMDAAFDAGVNFFDTANTYAKGRSEEILGELLKGRRHEAVIATKCFNPTGDGPNDSGSSRQHIMRAVEDSLRRLQTDYIDVYYLHHTDVETPLDETLRALDDLVRDGKVRYIACSNYEAWRLLESIWISDTKGLERFTAYQPQYNLVVRDIEAEIVPVCAQGRWRRRLGADRRRLPHRQIPARAAHRGGHPLGRELGVHGPHVRGECGRDTRNAAAPLGRDGVPASRAGNPVGA